MLKSTRHQLIAAICFVCAASVSLYEFFSAGQPSDNIAQQEVLVAAGEFTELESGLNHGVADTILDPDSAVANDSDNEDGALELKSSADSGALLDNGGDALEQPTGSDPQKVGESRIILCVNSGDTLMSMLTNCGISRSHAHAAIQALAKKFNLRRLKIGQEIVVVVKRNIPESQANIVSLELKTSPESTLFLTRSDSGKFAVENQKLELIRKVKHVTGRVETTLYSALRNSGVPARISRQAASALSNEVNLKHAKPGDKFEVIYAVKTDKAGNLVKIDGLDYVAFAPKGKLSRMYRFKPKNCPEGFYNHKGQALSAAKMCIPIRAKYRISSRFGYRRDPFVRSMRKFHPGIDLAAPKGTPVYAAASGVVKTAGWHGGYGKFIKISHNSEIATAYGHLSKILVKRGQYVKKGTLIGRVGSTGRSTACHLHFEVRKKGKRVNPLKNVSLPVQKLKGQDKRRFEILKNAIMKQAEGIPLRQEIVASSAPN